MTPDEFAKRGRALYGERWQTQLARDLKVSDRTVRRWARGDSPIPEKVDREILVMLKEHYVEIREVLSDLYRRGASA